MGKIIGIDLGTTNSVVSVMEGDKPTVIVKGVVTRATDKKPLGTWILVEDLKTGDLVATVKSNSATGKYLVVLPAGRTYSVSANRDGYFFHSQKFDVPADARFAELERNIALSPIQKGSRVVLNNIFFETGKAVLSPESKVELRKAVDMMKRNKSMVIEVGGHTDNVGKKKANKRLSAARAKAVRKYLIDAGIAAARIKAKGYGDTAPIADNGTEEGRAKNRRTEFVILEF